MAFSVLKDINAKEKVQIQDFETVPTKLLKMLQKKVTEQSWNQKPRPLMFLKNFWKKSAAAPFYRMRNPKFVSVFRITVT